MNSPLVLAGCGKMGRALLEGWLERGIEASSIIIVEPSAETAEELRDQYAVKVIESPEKIGDDVRLGVIVFAVKPQVMDDVAPAYRRFSGHDCAFLSIAAGKTIGYFEGKLGKNAPIVRCMPNTPAAVRRGVTVACPNGRVSAGQQRLCNDLLAAVGEVAWIDDEGLLDAVTAVSGSGPAYVFLLTECLAEAEVEAGLPEDLAAQLARATVIGAGELMRQSKLPAEKLRHNVTSPGGTTAEALRVLLSEDGLPSLLAEAVAAATRRSRELAD